MNIIDDYFIYMSNVSSTISVPSSWEEVIERYRPLPWEDEKGFCAKWMKLWYPPPDYTWPFTRIYCNIDIHEDLTNIFNEIIYQDIVDSIETFDGCYVIRPIRGSTRWSLHSFGIALDFNASTNQLGTDGNMNEALIDIFESFGWVWGGRFRRKDPMHFQRAKGC